MSQASQQEILAELAAKIHQLETTPTGTAEQVHPVGEDDEHYQQGKKILLRQLTARPRSSAELEKKLIEQEIPHAAAAALIARFTELGLIDDAEFARQWVAQRQEHKGLARAALARELSEKGVSEENIHNALAQLDEDDEYAAAEQLVAKKLRTLAPLDPQDPNYRREEEKYLRRIVSLLQRKGYRATLAFQLARDAVREHQI